MSLVLVHDSGAEQWRCATCGRQILLWWSPEYRRRVLVPGDEVAYHAVSKGGLVVRSASASEGTVEEPRH